MVSRRKILNRSRDDLNIDQEEEDIWYQKDKLFKVSLIWIHFVFAFCTFHGQSYEFLTFVPLKMHLRYNFWMIKCFERVRTDGEGRRTSTIRLISQSSVVLSLTTSLPSLPNNFISDLFNVIFRTVRRGGKGRKNTKKAKLINNHEFMLHKITIVPCDKHLWESSFTFWI